MGRGSWSLAVPLFCGGVEEVGAGLLPRAGVVGGGFFDWQLVDLGLHGVDAPGGLDLGEGLGRVDLAACVVGEAGELLLPGEAELAREGGDGGELLVADRLRLGVRRGRGGGGWWPGGCWWFGDGLPLVGLHRVVGSRGLL